MAATLVVRYLGTAHPQLGQNPTRRVKALEGAELTEASPAVSRVKPQLYPMELGRTPDLFHGQFVPDRVGGCGHSGSTGGGRPAHHLAA